VKITSEDLLSPGEVAHLFGVDVKTVTRWAQAGKLTSIRTPGNHRRYSAPEVYRMRDASRVERTT
jgi:excisionase family DNA binding protein